MNGISMAKLAKNAGDALHVLLMTDKHDNNILKNIRKERLDGFLVKPVFRNELIEKVEAILDAVTTEQSDY
jgi:DNA-binding NarL/FixJ family response regulator